MSAVEAARRAITAEGLAALRAELEQLESEGAPRDGRAHQVRARARRSQGERRVPHRQGGPGAPGDADHAAAASACATRASSRRDAATPTSSSFGTTVDGRRRGRAAARRRYTIVGPTEAEPGERQAVGRVARRPGADGPRARATRCASRRRAARASTASSASSSPTGVSCHAPAAEERGRRSPSDADAVDSSSRAPNEARRGGQDVARQLRGLASRRSRPIEGGWPNAMCEAAFSSRACC